MMDFTKSYGTITGHSWARYVQGGTLYDGEGKSYDEQGEERGSIVEESVTGYQDSTQLIENAREYLQRILQEGPMGREDIHKETQILGYEWAAMTNAATEMKIKSYKTNGKVYWRLAVE